MIHLTLRKDTETVKEVTTMWGSGHVEIKVKKRSFWSTMKAVGEGFLGKVVFI